MVLSGGAGRVQCLFRSGPQCGNEVSDEVDYVGAGEEGWRGKGDVGGESSDCCSIEGDWDVHSERLYQYNRLRGGSGEYSLARGHVGTMFELRPTKQLLRLHGLRPNYVRTTSSQE